ncbi:MAG: hypothetical protein LBC18_04255 [Opitutaceae bacterium]|jgi:hypothetical protein|nr:hypothetical protein [Opitutaceae bacterium]
MKKHTFGIIALIALVLSATAALFAADAVPAEAGAATGIDLSATVIAVLLKVAAWYGVACAGFNGLVTLIAAVVKKTPGASDDEAIDKLYESKPYKAVAWIFSWGDYIAELVTKLKK